MICDSLNYLENLVNTIKLLLLPLGGSLYTLDK
jgi:hypothetical protein